MACLDEGRTSENETDESFRRAGIGIEEGGKFLVCRIRRIVNPGVEGNERPQISRRLHR